MKYMIWGFSRYKVIQILCYSKHKFHVYSSPANNNSNNWLNTAKWISIILFLVPRPSLSWYIVVASSDNCFRLSIRFGMGLAGYTDRYLSLPIFLFYQIEYGAMALVFSGNVMMFCSILAYFIVFESEDDFGF